MMQTSNILISVRRKYVDKMLAGEKTIELRRRALRILPGTRVWIYSTAPICAVEVQATVVSIVTDAPEFFWRRHKDRLGLSRAEFDAYLHKAEAAWGLVLHCLCALPKSVPLSDLRKHSRSFQPPQFFSHLNENHPALKALTAQLPN